MTDTIPPDRAKHWRAHLDRAIAAPGSTIVLATLDADRSMVLQTATTRPQDLVDVARALLQQALDRINDEIDAAMAAGLPAEPGRDDLAMAVEDAITLLPDPHEDDSGDGK